MDAHTTPSANVTIREWANAHTDSLTDVRRQLHAHPELSGQEYVTTEFLLRSLEGAGLDPRRLPVGTGLVCDIGPAGSDARPTLAIRADIDALAMPDLKSVPYRSTVDGVAHACGHDVHTTIMLGVALFLAEHRDLLVEPIRVIFQPAEEQVPGGALAVIDAGGLDGIEAILGLHCDPKLETGRIGLRAGPITSAADLATIVLTGPGGHTARPELTVDLATVAARTVCDLPAAVRSLIEEPADLKVVFGAIRAGDAANVIPTRAELRVALRTQSLAVWEQLPALFEKSLVECLDGSGAGYTLDYTTGVPPVVNDPELVEVVRRAATREFGAAAVAPAVQSWGGDDFAWYTQRIPGVYVRLGVHEPDATAPLLDLHAGMFDVDERSIPLGVRLVLAALDEFHRRPVAGPSV